MEEILASIRRIIAEDGQLPAGAASHLKSVNSEGATPAAADPPQSPPPAASRPVDIAADDDDDEVLELTEPADPEPEPEPAPMSVSIVEAIELDRPMDVTDHAARAQERPEPAAGLVDEQVAAASAERLAALSPFAGTAPPATDNPFEALVREMVRPMLKDWLDAYLPNIVEKLVSQEISRITGKGR